MNKKKKIFIISLIVIICIVVFALIIVAIQNNKKSKNGVYNENSSLYEILDFYHCKFYREVNSDEMNFSKDIYMSFASDPVTNGLSRKSEYEKIFGAVAIKIKNNFRLLDEARNIIVRVSYNKEKGTIQYTVNSETNFFDREKQRQSISKSTEIKQVSLNFKSEQLNSLLQHSWNRRASNLGTVDSTCDGYEYYFDEGYKVKSLNSKVLNIIFTKQYKDEVIDGIKTEMSNNEVKSKLGEPSFNFENGSYIGYKTDKMYAFFYEGEISIFPTNQFDEEKNNKFAELVSNYLNDDDYKKLISEVQVIYPDYYSYNYDEKSAEIDYPNIGFKIKFDSNNKYENGITFYGNYQGKITNDILVNELKDKSLPEKCYYIDEDYIFYTDRIRAFGEEQIKIPDFAGMNSEQLSSFFAKSENYSGIYFKEENKISFYSLDKNNYDSEILSISNLTKIYSISNNEFVYGIKGNGLYYYNALTKNKKKIVSSEGNCDIKKIENDTIFYDETSIKIIR